VIDPETQAVLPPGTQGILEVISPRIGPDWIRTADVGVIDADGFLFLLGRLDGAIMRGGFKLLPETIERALLLHPKISAANVVGVPDRRLGQVPAAAFTIKPGFEPPTSAELEAHLREHVPATHIPVLWRFVEEIPKTPSFKIDRPALRRLFEEQRDERSA
jgi:acyl-CoA synthetase (AMP-forming)/AMP-acid ligase II